GSMTGPVASGAALHRAALVLAESTPDAGVLTGLERPLQALLDHRAAAADGLGFLDLQQRRTGVADGEEELGVFLAANGVVTPVHGCYLSLVLLRVACECERFHESLNKGRADRQVPWRGPWVRRGVPVICGGRCCGPSRSPSRDSQTSTPDTTPSRKFFWILRCRLGHSRTSMGWTLA